MAKRSLLVPIGRYSGVPVIFLGLSRKRFRKRLRQWRRKARAFCRRILDRFEGLHPEVAAVLAVLAGPCRWGTAGPGKAEIVAVLSDQIRPHPAVLDILDTTPLNLQGTSPL